MSITLDDWENTDNIEEAQAKFNDNNAVLTDAVVQQSSGTWTPTIDGSSGGNGAMDGSTIGTYTKTGTQVFVKLFAQLTGKGTIGAGELIRINGLPFTVKNEGNSSRPCLTIGSVAEYIIPATTHYMNGTAPQNTTRIELAWFKDAGPLSVQGVDLDTTFTITAAMVYETT